MSQGTPRKFSEKIAILERKQNEEEETFHSVMRDVRAITSVNKTSNSQSAVQSAIINNSNYSYQENQATNSGMGCKQVPSQVSEIIDNSQAMSMNWNRNGGSLPNVHAMVQQQPLPGGCANWNNWQVPYNASVHSPVRIRSPGAHYHPYQTRSSNYRNGKHPAENNNASSVHGMMHLQPPNPSWSKARSDPAIHKNIAMCSSVPQIQANNHQWQSEYRHNSLTPNSAQQISQFVSVPSFPTPGLYGASAAGSLFGVIPPPIVQVQAPQHPQQQHPRHAQNQQQQQALQQLPTTSFQNQQFQNSPMTPLAPSSHHQHQNQQLQQQQQQQGQQHRSLQQFEMDMSLGSLPNMHHQLSGFTPPSLPQQPNFQRPPPVKMLPTTSEVGRQSTYPQVFQSNIVESGNLSPSAPLSSTVATASIPPQMYPLQQQQRQQLSTPAVPSQSQSAPTSPAQSNQQMRCQQWPATRHFSASPETFSGVPNICVTGTDGNENLDCFQDLQYLHLDNEIQQLLRDPDEQVDPLTETQLLS